MNFEELVEMINDIYLRSDAENVYEAIDEAYQIGKIQWWQADTLTDITRKVAKTAW